MPTVVNPSKYLGNELTYLEKVLSGDSWSATTGSWNHELERQFATLFGMKYGVALNSGTSTLHAALEAAGIGAGDEVISPALTVIMDATATFHTNAVPVFADVNAETFNMDPADVERKITSRTKAIIPVALYGLPPALPEIMDIARRHNLVVIEDNAQCVLGRCEGQLAGTFGHMASYSFENTKHISCGEGGMIVTNDEGYAERVRKIGGHGFKNLRASEGRVRLNQDTFQRPDYLRHDMLGWNYRLPEFCAAVALAQLERIEDLVRLRQESARVLLEAMSACNYLIPQATPANYINAYYTLGVTYEGQQSIGVSWQDFRKAYMENGGDGIYGAWAVPYLEPMIAERQFVQRCPQVYEDVRYERGLCPVAERTQPKLMQFKTNYRDVGLAEKKAAALERTIRQLGTGR